MTKKKDDSALGEEYYVCMNGKTPNDYDFEKPVKDIVIDGIQITRWEDGGYRIRFIELFRKRTGR